ncbi:unnamed protein product [Symbiodinium sp. KB8]|nr:unnamed protein product [Symbiodinium sp. KB8]
MLAQVSPHPDDTTETVCSLTFARRAAQVELGCAQKGVVGSKAPSRKPTQSSRTVGASPSSPDAMQELLAERVEGLQLELSRTEGQVIALRGEVAASATALAEAKAQHNDSKTTSEAEITALRERIARLSSLLEGVSTPAAATRGSACPASRRFSCVAVTDRPRRGLEAGVENTPPRTPGVFSTAEVLVATPRTAPRSAAVGFAAASKTAPLPATAEDLGQSKKTLHFADEAWAKPAPSASQQRAGAASSKPKARRPKTAPRQRLAATLGPSTVANQGRRQGGLAAKRSGSASATRRPRSAARYANVKPRIDTGRSARSIAAGRSRRAAQQAEA